MANFELLTTPFLSCFMNFSVLFKKTVGYSSGIRMDASPLNLW